MIGISDFGFVFENFSVILIFCFCGDWTNFDFDFVNVVDVILHLCRLLFVVIVAIVILQLVVVGYVGYAGVTHIKIIVELIWINTQYIVVDITVNQMYVTMSNCYIIP